MDPSEQHQQQNENSQFSYQPRENVPNVSRNVQQRGQFEMIRSPAQYATVPIPRATNKNPHVAPKEQGYHRGNLSEVPTQLSHSMDDNQHDERRRARVVIDDPGNRRPSQVSINTSNKPSKKRQRKRTRRLEYDSDQNDSVPDNRASQSSEHEQQSRPKKALKKARNMEQSQQPDENNSDTSNDDNQMDDGNESDYSDHSKSASYGSHFDSSSDQESSRPGRSTSKGSSDSKVIIKCSTGIRFDSLNAAHEKVIIEFENVTAMYELTKILVKQKKHK